MAMRGGVGQDRLPKGNEIKIEGAHPPAGFALTTMGMLNAVEKGQHLFRGSIRREGARDGGIHIIGTGPCGKAGGCIYPAGHEGAELGGEFVTSKAQGLNRGAIPLRKVGTKGDEQSLAAVRHRFTLSYS